MRQRFTLLALLAALAACSGPAGSDGGSDSATDTAGPTDSAGMTFQCSGDTSTAPNTFCAEYDASVSESAARMHCSSSRVMGTFATGACRTTGRVGRCTYADMGVAVVTSFYMPVTAEQAMTSCQGVSGMFQAD